MSDLDPHIDELYRQPLDVFIAARTRLAKTVKGDEAKRVRALAKPTVVPWAVNQVYWHARRVFDALMTTGAAVRHAQVAALEGRKADVRAANEAHRRAVTEAVKEAVRLAGASGLKPDAEALMRTFEAISLAPTPAEAPGRWTRPLQPSGFEALGGLTLKPLDEAAAAKRAAAAKLTAKQEEAARRKAEAAQKKHDAEMRKAEKTLERARRRMAEAESLLRETRKRAP